MFVLANSLKNLKNLLVKKNLFQVESASTIYNFSNTRSVDNIARLFWVKNSDLSDKLKKIRVRHFFWDLFKADLNVPTEKQTKSLNTQILCK